MQMTKEAGALFGTFLKELKCGGRVMDLVSRRPRFIPSTMVLVVWVLVFANIVLNIEHTRLMAFTLNE